MVESEGEVIVRVRCPTCPWCRQASVVKMPLVAYDKIQSGATIASALPDWSPGQREMLITGTHPLCWTAMFGTGEDPEEDDPEDPSDES